MTEDQLSEIDAVAQRPPMVALALHGTTASAPSAGIESLSAKIAGEAARDLLRAQAGTLADAAERIVAPGSAAWIDEAPMRQERGESEIARLDLLYQSPDWDRAAGRREGSFDIISE